MYWAAFGLESHYKVDIMTRKRKAAAATTAQTHRTQQLYHLHSLFICKALLTSKRCESHEFALLTCDILTSCAFVYVRYKGSERAPAVCTGR